MALADQVDDQLATVTLLNAGERERGDLRAAQAAGEESGQDGAIADALARGWVGCAKVPPNKPCSLVDRHFAIR